MAKKIDMVGWVMKEHGVPRSRLTVLYEAPQSYKIEHNIKSTKTYWVCLCECGRLTVVCGVALRSGSVLSCGCLQKEVTSKNSVIDLTGRQIGKLFVEKRVGSYQGHEALWFCLCACGGNTTATTHDLLSGHTTSCGCVKSKGEEKIAKILSENDIPFVKQYSFQTLRSEKNGILRYDFFINNQFLLEYDGSQHFKETRGWDKTEKNFQQRQEYDIIKNNYAKSHNIPLKRIPYWDFDQITLENIMSDKWLINN